MKTVAYSDRLFSGKFLQHGLKVKPKIS